MILAVLQARMGSSRLPGKSMATLRGEPMIVRQLERLRGARCLSKIVVATSSGAASAAGTSQAYPPPPPSHVTTSTCPPGGSQCGVEPTKVTKTPHTPQHNNHHPLASTGFDTALALTVVAVLIVGGVALVMAGRRGRRTY